MKNPLLFIVLVCYSLYAENYRETKPLAWSALSVKDALTKLYGTDQTFQDNRINIKLPKVASNGGSIPLHIETTIDAKSIAVLQDVNPKALVAVYSVLANTIPMYDMKIKMSASGTVLVVVEGKDGKLYSHCRFVEIALGGCDGSSVSYAPTYYRQATYKPMSSTSTTEDEGYNSISENRFKNVMLSPLSTLSTDVDTASYANIRRYLFENKKLPQNGVVRIEEMLNYFDYHYTEPTKNVPFAIHTKVGMSIWNDKTKLLHIGLQTKKPDIEVLPPSNLVFLLDVSGSMGQANKLPLLTKSLALLVKQLRKVDRVSIVVYAGSSGLVLDRARGDETHKIIESLERLRAGGSTAGGSGINLAYEVAQKAFIKDGNNRIILATDGDFNVGPSSQSALVELIEEKRKIGIYLSVLGFGMGNYKDNKMELLADKGNGNYAYIDTLLEAKKVLVTQMSGTLYTVAKDVKIQVEFNPAKVRAYRLIGYENRLLNSQDFKDDNVDAAEVGMGHSVTALYEVMMQEETAGIPTSTLKYQTSKIKHSEELATVKIRYKHPDSNSSLEMEKDIHEGMNEINTVDFLFAQSVAGFGMLLRDSAYKNTLTYKKLITNAKDNKGSDREGYRAECIKMMEKAELLSGGL